jgi:two-component system cell cycle response regulator
MSNQPIKVLMIEDSPGDTRLIQEHLTGARVTGTLAPAFELVVADRLTAGLARLAAGGIDVVLLDLSLPDSQGLDTFVKVQAQMPDMAVVVLTGLDDEALASQAVQLGAQDYLVKGQIDRNLLGRAVRYAVERHRLLADLRAMSLTDPLTGLYNRRGFFALAEQQLKMAHRFRQGLLLLFADLDDFKQINDTAGHHVGDQALREAAAALRETFRTSDILARLGGDEFAVVAINALDQDAEAVLARLRRNLEARNAARSGGYRLVMSIGSVRYQPDHLRSVEELLAEADARMYEDKRRKRTLPNAASG